MVDFTPEEYAEIIASDQHAFTEESFLQVSPADEFSPSWHIDCIIEHLAAVERGEIKRLIINIPPRSLKSICVAIAWPAWLLGKDPRRRVICASYGDALAKRHSLDSRLIMESPIYKLAFPQTKLASDQNEKGMFMTTQRGFRKATSVGGQVLGDGGDFIVWDDLLKADEAPSDTVRNNTNTWLDQALIPRLNNPTTGAIVGVMQRLHMDDPTGHLIEKGGWQHLCLPAEFKRKTFIEVGGKKWAKEEGDLLHPTRLSRDVLDQKQRELGPMGYAGQYMQSPTPPDGGDFKGQWLKHYDIADARSMNVFILYDPANEKKRNAGHDPDWSVMVVVGLAPDNNYYVLDMVRDRLNPHERIHALIKLHKKWNARCGKPPKVGCEQYGMMTDAFYLQKSQRDINYRFPLITLAGQMKKEDRIRKLIAPFQEERVYLPKTILYTTSSGERLDLVKELVTEYDTFPVGRHDDIMDALARIMDEKLNAAFPKLVDSTTYYGQRSADDFNPSDFRSW